MKIKITNEGIKSTSLIKMISIGYAISTTLLFSVVLVIFALTKNQFPLHKILPAFVIIPFVAILQGLILGCAITFGLFIYKKWHPIEIG